MAHTTLEELSYDDCLRHLREAAVCRLAVVMHDFPMIVPVNYRVVETLGLTWIALRTRPGNLIEQAPMHAALEIDQIDASRHLGWSVMVRGTLHRVDPDAADFRERFDAHPWLTADRDAWMVVQPFLITGRRLVVSDDAIADLDWTFDT